MRRGKRADAQPTFEAFYRDTYAPAVRYVRGRASDCDAEALVADAFLLSWQHFLKTGDLRRSWFFSVIRNKLGDHYRARKRRRHEELDEYQLPANPDFTDISIRREMVLEVLRLLSPDHREALELTYWAGLDATEAADLVQISPSAFRQRLTRARAAFMEQLMPSTTGQRITRKGWLRWIESNG